jgi:hypothetical protein
MPITHINSDILGVALRESIGSLSTLHFSLLDPITMESLGRVDALADYVVCV